MARRYYTRYRPRTYRAKRKWSPTLVNGTITTSAQAGTTATAFVVLCENSANVGTNTPVSTIVKVKNARVVLDPQSNVGSSIRNSFYAIMYVPQGYQLTAETPTQHPEWIMVWRTIDTAGDSRNITMSSRLTRNLNSGDKIVLYHSMVNVGTGLITSGVTFFASFVTCNN